MTESHTRAARELSDQALSRAGGAPLISGNRVRLLKDAAENYPAWIQAIQSARHWVHFETYFIRDDEVGRQFANALSEKVKQGVKVRLLYDWLGALGHASRRFWRRLEEAGVEVRSFNPPRLDSPLGWISRDHRKLVAVDGRIAYVAGLCVGASWAGQPDQRVEPWRDTGVEIEGPALEDLERAFADSWGAAGLPLPAEEIPPLESVEPVGNVALRIIANVPSFGGTYRLDQLFAQLARRSIWINDSYFLGTASYVQALRTAAQSGVDVRIIVPGLTDVTLMRTLSRAGFRPLLEAGVRVFQWNGSMMHAKTAVVDGTWARVGSTNLNLASWLGNWEMDVVVEDSRFAQAMEELFADDLTRTTEIVLDGWRRRPRSAKSGLRLRRGSAPRVAAGVMRFSHTVSAAMTNRRELGPAEANVMALAALLLIAFSIVAARWPRAVVLPIVILCVWISLTLLLRAWKLRSKKRGGR